jgi:hypothetical protein
MSLIDLVENQKGKDLRDLILFTGIFLEIIEDILELKIVIEVQY